MKKNKIFSVALIVVIAIFIVALSISLPILIRPFFYMQIDALELQETTGLERAEIVQAYNEMMDFCLGFRSDFSAGVLPFSERGASHFADVRTLFILDFVLVIVCGALLVTAFILWKKKILTPYRFKGRSAPFWSVISIFSICAVIGISCAINFKATFIFFHKIFFPGKTNWTFNPRTDPIIRLLPNQFFSNCAVLIFGGILLSCIAIFLWEFLPRKKNAVSG